MLGQDFSDLKNHEKSARSTKNRARKKSKTPETCTAKLVARKHAKNFSKFSKKKPTMSAFSKIIKIIYDDHR